MSEPTERWLPVTGWEGLYEVSDLGRVRSLPRWSVARKRWYGGQVRKPAPRNDHGHLGVMLYRDRRFRTYWVHRLVLEAFAGPCPDGQLCCHGPGGPQDNRLVNLRWGTPGSNAADKYRDGTILTGARNHQSKLNEQSVREIRTRRAAGQSMQSIADAHGVTLVTIWQVIHGVTWRHIE
jgi:NUMOD4 motif/HNH endonuclease